MFLPAKAPRDIVDKLNRETLKALQEPKVRDRLTTLGFDPMVMTAPSSQRMLRRRSQSTRRS
jgi:tripartite-type tricarboxylate transporter receptor subunit TctC